MRGTKSGKCGIPGRISRELRGLREWGAQKVLDAPHSRNSRLIFSSRHLDNLVVVPESSCVERLHRVADRGSERPGSATESIPVQNEANEHAARVHGQRGRVRIEAF